MSALDEARLHLITCLEHIKKTNDRVIRSMDAQEAYWAENGAEHDDMCKAASGGVDGCECAIMVEIDGADTGLRRSMREGRQILKGLPI